LTGSSGVAPPPPHADNIKQTANNDILILRSFP
jgi:hypothetical protein